MSYFTGTEYMFNLSESQHALPKFRHSMTKVHAQLDGVPGTQTSRFLLSYTTAIEATALFVQQHVKGAIIVWQQVKGAIIADLYHVTPPHGEMAAIPDDCDRTATVALPIAASSGFISGDVGIRAALDAFSTVYELPLTRF